MVMVASFEERLARRSARKDADRPLREYFAECVSSWGATPKAHFHASHESWLAPLFDSGISVGGLSPDHVIVWVEWLLDRRKATGDEYSPAYLRGIFATLQAVGAQALRDGIRSDNPTINLPRNLLPAVPRRDPDEALKSRRTLDEVQTVLSDLSLPPFSRTWFALACLTGLRYGEQCELRLRDIDMVAPGLWRLTVSRAYQSTTKRVSTTKTGESRSLPVHPALEFRLRCWLGGEREAYCNRRCGLGDRLLPRRTRSVDDRVRRTQLYRAYREIRAAHDMHHTTVHDLRATFCSLVREAGCNPAISTSWTHHNPAGGSGNATHEGYVRPDWRLMWPQDCAEMRKIACGAALELAGDL